MTRALPITERQARALLKAAEREKGVVEIEIAGAKIRLLPSSLVTDVKPSLDKPPKGYL